MPGPGESSGHEVVLDGLDALGKTVLLPHEVGQYFILDVWIYWEEEGWPDDRGDDAREAAAGEAEVGSLASSVRCDVVRDLLEHLVWEREELWVGWERSRVSFRRGRREETDEYAHSLVEGSSGT